MHNVTPVQLNDPWVDVILILWFGGASIISIFGSIGDVGLLLKSTCGILKIIISVSLSVRTTHSFLG